MLGRGEVKSRFSVVEAAERLRRDQPGGSCRRISTGADENWEVVGDSELFGFELAVVAVERLKRAADEAGDVVASRRGEEECTAAA